MFVRFLCAVVVSFSGSWAVAQVEEDVPLVLREPSSLNDRARNPKAQARVRAIIDHKTLKATSHFNDWFIGEIIAAESQTPSVGVIGFLEVTGIENKQDGTYELTCELLRQSRVSLIQVGDALFHLDLSSGNSRYRGATDLLVRDTAVDVSSKYKPLYTQGVAVGETAHNLLEDEFLVTWYGQVNYGIKNWLTVSTIVPANFLGALNAGAKLQVFESFSNVFAVGLSYANVPNQPRSTLNLNMHWDSVSSESVLSHTLLTIALATFDEASDATAIKSFGTSSFQTGYEFILDNWDRILMGPSYNFEKKAVGGYLAYVKIWDSFHGSCSLNATDVVSFKLSPVDGYYVLCDAYWRF